MGACTRVGDWGLRVGKAPNGVPYLVLVWQSRLDWIKPQLDSLICFEGWEFWKIKKLGNLWGRCRGCVEPPKWVEF